MKFQAVQLPDIEIIMYHALICLLYEYETWAGTSTESTYLEGIWEQGDEESIWIYKGRNNKRLEQNA